MQRRDHDGAIDRRAHRFPLAGPMSITKREGRVVTNDYTLAPHDAADTHRGTDATIPWCERATHIHVFNGDADGLCALQQLRLVEGEGSALVTGVKRDIRLLARVNADADCCVTVLDLSHDSNRDDVARLLAGGAAIRYFDHHFAGSVPSHPALQAHIDTSTDVCTSTLVDRYLGGRHAQWAVAAAFGDSLPRLGAALAHRHALAADTVEALALLGRCLNYNAYGDDPADLFYAPEVLAEAMLPYADPLAFVAGTGILAVLAEGYRSDLHEACAVQPEYDLPGVAMLVLPSQRWARRVSGVLANELMQQRPGRALAVLSPRRGGGYVVSVRVPAGRQHGADDFCRGFATGGGRKLAAGINHLAECDVDRFASEFRGTYAD
ncbi:acetyltransferase [Burkholderia gladioli]|nr:acetyltransferase [Burkholderia gladioli]MDN7806512.1 acetyltransferase [Burkholderia gladioli]